MKRLFVLFALVLTSALPSALSAAPGGLIGTLPTGTYRCELPGDALGPVGHPVPEADFTVITASAYRAGGIIGSYLLTGDTVHMTSGPFKGRRYHRITAYFLRVIEPDGSDGRMRCVRPRGRRR